jgi:hypothetical protein
MTLARAARQYHERVIQFGPNTSVYAIGSQYDSLGGGHCMASGFGQEPSFASDRLMVKSDRATRKALLFSRAA